MGRRRLEYYRIPESCGRTLRAAAKAEFDRATPETVRLALESIGRLELVQGSREDMNFAEWLAKKRGLALERKP